MTAAAGDAGPISQAPDRRTHMLGVASLALAGLMFGVTFMVVQDAIGRADVGVFLGVRFLIAGAILAPIALRRRPSQGEFVHGVLAGLCLLGGYVFQTVGLHDTTAAASAFITYLLVVIVPVLVTVRLRRLPPPKVIAGVALAVAGLSLLAGSVDGFGRGEALTLVAALMFALHIMVLGAVAGRHDPFRLTMWQVLTVAVACLGAGLVGGPGLAEIGRFDGGVWVAAIFTGVGATAVAFWCMSWAQRVVPETQAAIILLLEPVSAALLGELVGDHLGWRGGFGAVLIISAVVVTEVVGRRPVVVGAELAIVTHDPVTGEIAAVDPAAEDPSSG